MKQRFGFFIFVLFISAIGLQAQEPVGIFDGAVDIGDAAIEGGADVDGDYYQVEASGSGLDDFADSGFFVYKELSGNFIIEGVPYALGGGMGGLMIRQDTEAGAPFAAYVRQSNGDVFPRFRTLRDEAMTDDSSVAFSTLLDGSMRMERVGNTINFYTLDLDENWVLQQTENIQLTDPVTVGLFSTADNNDNIEFFDFEAVQIDEYPFSVSRSFSIENPLPGDSITVTLSAQAGDVSNATVTEMIPTGTTISNVAATSGTFVDTGDGEIQWSLADFNGDAELIYTIQLLNQPVSIWRGTFTDGTHDGFIGGRMFAAETVGFQPRESFSVHPTIPRFIEAEWGRMTGAERTFGLQFDPNSEGGFLVQSAIGDSGAIVDGVLEYTLDVQQSGTYYVFAQCRRENDQSDSFFMGFDAIDATDEYAYPIAGTKALARRWWYTFQEGLRFWDTTTVVRPFELTAGQHTLYLAPRETNASIDWFVITSDPTLTIGAFAPKESFFTVTRRLPSTGSTLPASITVSLEVGVVEGSDAELRLEEYAPEGWTLSDLNFADGDANIQDNKITWTVSQLNNDSLVTYTATPPADAVLGIFSGSTYNSRTGVELPIYGNNIVPDQIPFELRTDPIDVSPTDVTFIQAENPHAVSGDYVVQADDTLASLLYAMPTSSGRTGGALLDQELTFELNVLEAGTYYIFANMRSESDQTDSFYIGFDIDFVGVPDSTDSDIYGYVVPSRNVFGRSWYRLFEPGQRFWVLTDELHAFELSAGPHTLNWHSREPEAKVDWIAITSDPTLDIATVLEPGQEPDVAVGDYMLY